MALHFLGKDPESPVNDSPTVYYDDATEYILQGPKLDTDTLTEVGRVPEHETLIRFPRRMMQFFPEANGGSDVH